MILLLLACALEDSDAPPACVDIIEVSPSYDECVSVASDGDAYYDDCCPDGWEYLAMGTAGVLCQWGGE